MQQARRVEEDMEWEVNTFQTPFAKGDSQWTASGLAYISGTKHLGEKHLW